ncbi:MAG: tail fiber protein [Okeania sp. SIO3B5]|uniref:phage tail protein n=1 Tax=Okeania sp. SIO3B5 TaxID=2607811 RepID=UPI0014001EF1|nr:phage tail protein [Okeania sp. SIO3B5]NEO55203.1 tail fiber protein [Okeania sp. SIO3B5]
MNKKRIFGAAIAILLAVTLFFGIEVNSASANIEVDCSKDSTGEVPIGTISAYGGVVTGNDARDLENQGWLVCDGEEYPIKDYEALYCKIGTYFGTASRPELFKVPDLRGRFVRGVDSGTGRDPDAADRTASAPGGNTGDQVGSFQEDAFKKHSHKIEFNDLHQARNPDGNRQGQYQEEDGLSTSSVGGSETRPKNIYVNWIIKAEDKED